MLPPSDSEEESEEESGEEQEQQPKVVLIQVSSSAVQPFNRASAGAQIAAKPCIQVGPPPAA